MITNKEELMEYLKQDALANGKESVKAKMFGDSIWKSIVCLRKKEYYMSLNGIRKKLYFPLIVWNKIRSYFLVWWCGFSISPNIFDKGLSIVHMGTIVVNPNAKIGKNCRIHEGVTIGATNGSDKAPVIGDNVFIASGTKIIGDIHIADDVCIGANAVVVKSIKEPGTTWGGVPAKKISNNNSHSNLNKLLRLDE